MLKKTSILLWIACCLSCQTRKPDLLPPAGPYFQSLGIKFNFSDGTVRQNGRLYWRFDDHCAKFILFTPLNQVGLELDVASESAVLVNFAKKAFWRGDFMVLLDRLWGIKLGLAPLKQLLVNGIVPQAELDKQGIVVHLENNAKSGAPQTVRLRRGTTDLTLRIYKNESHPGKIILIDYSSRYQAEDLENVLNDD
jgi:hypothetical protein